MVSRTDCVVLSVLVSLMFINSSSSIKCYECNSQNNSMCLDPLMYDTETLRRYLQPVRCGQGQSQGVYAADQQRKYFCRKMIQTIFHKEGAEPDVRVSRGCGWVRHHRDCYKADNDGHLETVCQCFTDDCNSATVAGISTIVLALTAATVFY